MERHSQLGFGRRLLERVKANRAMGDDLGALRAYAYFIAGAWSLAAFGTTFVCLLVLGVEASIWTSLAITSFVMTSIWVALAVRAHRRGYLDLCRFRLEVAFGLSVLLFGSLISLLELSGAMRYLFVIPFVAVWAIIQKSLRIKGKRPSS